MPPRIRRDRHTGGARTLVQPDIEIRKGAARFVGLEVLERRFLMSAVYEVTDLGTLGGPESLATTVNETLQVAGRSLLDPAPASTRAFRWQLDTGLENLGSLPGFARSEATAINEAGDVVGTALNAVFDERAFLSRPGQELIDVGTLGGTWSRGADINDLGQIVGTSSTAAVAGGAADPFAAFVWSEGVLTDLGTLGGESSIAKALNENGTIVGLSFPAGNEAFHAFAWSDGIMTDLGTLGGPASSAHDIDDDGVIVGDADLVRRDENGFHRFHAAVWDEGVRDLGTLGGKFSSAAALNHSRRIVGWSEIRKKDALGDRKVHAFEYHEGDMRDLNDLIDDPDHWELQRATAINDQSYIVGEGLFRAPGQDGPGDLHAFILRPLFPDLAVHFKTLKLPSPAIPGDRVKARLEITNLGETDAVGRGDIEIFASPDATFDETDLLVAQLSNRRIRLRPGQSRKERIRFDLPADLPPGDYHIMARIQPSAGIEESDATNNTATTETPHPVVWMFGDLDDRRGTGLTVEDSNGQRISFTMKGAGSGTVEAGPEGLDVQLDGTDRRSSVRILPAVRDDRPAVHDVTINGSLKAIDARWVDLLGDLNAAGTVRSLRFDDARGGHGITLGVDELGGGAPTSLTFDQVSDLSIVALTRIDRIEATTWRDTDGAADLIEAPALDRIEIRGNHRSNIAGDLDADLRLSGAAVDPDDLTLGEALVDGSITDRHWQITGHARHIDAGRIDPGWEGDFAGRIGMIDVHGDMSGRVSAEAIGSIKVGRDLQDAVVAVGPVTSGQRALDRLTAGRWMRRVDLHATGNIGVIRAGGVDRVNLFAGVRAESTDLPVSSADFSALASIHRLTIRGLRGEPASVIDTLVSAWSIRHIDVSRAGSVPATMPEASAISIAAHHIRSLTYRSDDTTLRLRRGDDFVTVDEPDVMVRII